jgi:ketosteroid isomerase-like protein
MGVKGLDQTVVDFFRAVDSMDVAAVTEAFTEDGTFRFGNNAPAAGRLHVEQAVGGFFSMIGGLTHDLIGTWSGTWDGGEVTSIETTVTYTRKDGSRTEPLPATTTLRMNGDRIQDLRIFMDIAPVFAQ